MDEDIIEILNLMKDKNNYTYIIEKLLKNYNKKQIENILLILNNNLKEKTNVLKDHLNSNVNFIINCSKIVNRLKDIQDSQNQQMNFLIDNIKSIKDKKLINEDYFPLDFVSNIKINSFIYNNFNKYDFYHYLRRIIRYFKGDNKDNVNVLADLMISTCGQNNEKYLIYQLKCKFKIKINKLTKYNIIIGILESISIFNFQNLWLYIIENNEYDDFILKKFEIKKEFFNILNKYESNDLAKKLINKYNSLQYDSDIKSLIKILDLDKIFLRLNNIKHSNDLANYKEELIKSTKFYSSIDNFFEKINNKFSYNKINLDSYLLFLYILNNLISFQPDNFKIKDEDQETYLNNLINLCKNNFLTINDSILIINNYFEDTDLKRYFINFEGIDDKIYQELYKKYNILMNYKIDSNLKLLNENDYLYIVQTKKKLKLNI